MALGVIDSFEFDPSAAYGVEIIHISGNVYAIVYQGSGSDGFIKTVSIDDAGDIDSVIDTFEFETNYAAPSCILYISGDIYAIAYSDSSGHGWIITVEIDSAGNITEPVVGSYEFDAVSGWNGRLVHVPPYGIYAITYTKDVGATWTSKLKTLYITVDGAIGGEIDELDFDTGSPNALTCDITQVLNIIFAIAHCSHVGGGVYRTCITTVDIDTAGEIVDAVIDRYEVEVNSAYTINTGKIIQVASGVFVAVAGRPSSPNNVDLFTFGIDGAGGISYIDTHVVGTHYTYSTPDIIKTEAGDYVIAYSDSAQYGRLKYLAIGDDGVIGDVKDTLLYQTTKANNPSIVGVTSTILAVGYTGVGSDGWLKTIGGIEEEVAFVPKIMII